MAKKKKINVQGISVTILEKGNQDYISLTDIAKQSSDEPRFVIQNWLRNNNTIRYLYEWETLHNPSLNRVHLHTLLEKGTDNRFTMSPNKWIDETNAVGIYVKMGRGGGTFAHSDIAVNFCYWLSPTFQIYLIKEFQRLKSEEAELLNIEWDLKRLLTKINYTVHTDAIKEHLIPPRLQGRQQGIVYSSEADLLNVAVFGMTAKEWRAQNIEVKGNIRDHATHLQLLILANLEAVNAELIRIGMAQDERLIILNKAGIKQTASLLSSPSFAKFFNPKKLNG